MRRKLQTITEQKQFRFAVAKALTNTAQQVRAEVQKNMRTRFSIRREWVIKGIRVQPATKSDLMAVVYSKDDFMGRQEYGTDKRPKHDKYLAIPMKAVRRSKSDIIRAVDLPNNLGKAQATMFRGGKSKDIKGAGGTVFFMKISGKLYLCRRRKGKDVEKMYLLVPRAKIPKRLGLEQDAMAISAKNFKQNLHDSLEYAIKTAK